MGGGGGGVMACEGGVGSSGALEEPRIASHPRLSSRNAIYLLGRRNYPFSERSALFGALYNATVRNTTPIPLRTRNIYPRASYSPHCVIHQNLVMVMIIIMI